VRHVAHADFSVFCAKVLAGIGTLPTTIADRAVPIVLARKKPSEAVTRFRRREVAPDFVLVRDGLAAWAAHAVDALRGLDRTCQARQRSGRGRLGAPASDCGRRVR